MSSFTIPVRVYIEDTDAGGIVYYVNYLKFMERARSEWLRASGLDQRTLLEAGIQLVVHRLDCRYARPARLDDELSVSAEVVEHSACRMCFRQEVRAARQEMSAAKEPLCEASVDIACVDAQRLRPIRWPAAIASALNG